MRKRLAKKRAQELTCAVFTIPMAVWSARRSYHLLDRKTRRHAMSRVLWERLRIPSARTRRVMTRSLSEGR